MCNYLAINTDLKVNYFGQFFFVSKLVCQNLFIIIAIILINENIVDNQNNYYRINKHNNHNHINDNNRNHFNS